MTYKNKEAVMKWREKNKEKYREIKKECQKRYYEKNKELLNKGTAEWYRKRNQRISELEEENQKLKADYIKLSKIVEINGGYRASYVNELRDKIAMLEKENRKLKNSIEYRKKKSESNQEKANQIDKIMNLPGVMVDGKIDWSKVAVYYCI